MMNKYRLHSTVFEREREEGKSEPKKVFFLSVEGNDTEKEYFEGISNFKAELGINALVEIELLRKYKRDTDSAPSHVIELLEEYLELRNNGTSSDNMKDDIPKKIVDTFGEETIDAYLNNPTSIKKEIRKKIDTELRKMSYDLNYRKYLNRYNNPNDKFAIIIDRDCDSHSDDQMKKCIDYCNEKKYSCYISNPLFEFWLLLHVSDVENEFDIEEIKKNKKVSNTHTYVSKALSEKVKYKHAKDKIKFAYNYKDNIDIAIQRAKSKTFASTNDELVDNVGTNIWQLIEEMRQNIT